MLVPEKPKTPTEPVVTPKTKVVKKTKTPKDNTIDSAYQEYLSKLARLNALIKEEKTP